MKKPSPITPRVRLFEARTCQYGRQPRVVPNRPVDGRPKGGLKSLIADDCHHR